MTRQRAQYLRRAIPRLKRARRWYWYRDGPGSWLAYAAGSGPRR